VRIIARFFGSFPRKFLAERGVSVSDGCPAQAGEGRGEEEGNVKAQSCREDDENDPVAISPF